MWLNWISGTIPGISGTKKIGEPQKALQKDDDSWTTPQITEHEKRLHSE